MLFFDYMYMQVYILKKIINKIPRRIGVQDRKEADIMLANREIKIIKGMKIIAKNLC